MDMSDIVWIVVVVAITGAAAYVLSQVPAYFSPPAQLATVSGHVTTTGFATSPKRITFISQDTHQTYTVPIVNGNYSTSLYAGETYNVSVYFHGILGTATSRNCQSVITIPSGTGVYTHNITC